MAGLAITIGFDRDRAFYPTVLMVIASYYVLFALMGASGRTLVIIEIVVATVFLLLAILGYKRNFWLVVGALVGHGAFDFVRRSFIENSGVPHWWPGFCLAFDVILGGVLTVPLMRHEISNL